MVLKQQYPSFSGIEFINNKDYVLSFLHKYITHNKFLTGFFDLKFSKNEIKINTAYTDLLHLNDPTSYNLDTYGITIKCKKDQLNILDYHNNVLFEKKLIEINNNNFFNDLINPLKNIIIKIDNQRKENFDKLWQEELYRYLSHYTSVNKKDFKNVKIEVFPPEDHCDFLERQVYSKRPKMDLHFLLNGKNIITSIKIREHYHNHEMDINEGYKLYKHVKQVNLDKKELESLVDISKPTNKIKRI